MLFYLEAEVHSKGVGVYVVTFQAEAGVMCLMEENVLRGFGIVCYIYKGYGRLFSPVFGVPIRSDNMSQPEDQTGRCQISRGILVITRRRHIQEGRLFGVLWAL